MEDNGIGIKPADVTKVFTPLKRLHRAEISGTGLGLAICKNIVERRGGTLWVESRADEGSTLYFTWPPERWDC